MRVLFSGFKDALHSQNGGYDKIIEMSIDKRILLSNSFLFGKSKQKNGINRTSRYILDIYTRILRYKYDITHLFYGELTTISIWPYVKLKGHKTIITLHLDANTFPRPNKFLSFLKSMDGIIVLSSQQNKLLKEKYGLNSIFIPHGFNKPLFNKRFPIDKKEQTINVKDINIITIGKNYRDFNTFHFVVKNCPLNIIFHLVGVPDEIKDLYKDTSNVRIYNRLSNDEYYSLLEACDYNFLPLTFATANNTLLEAQSLGVTSILPDIDGISDYAAPANLFYKNNNDILTILSLLKKQQFNMEIEKFSRKFTWNNIYVKLLEYYKSL